MKRNKFFVNSLRNIIMEYVIKGYYAYNERTKT